MRKKQILTILLTLVLTLSACSGSGSSAGRPLVRVVTRITISQDDVTRTYTSEESLEAILAYLRHLAPMTNADSIPTQGSIYRISLIYSDGSRQEFAQQDRYFRDTDGTWKNISEQNMLNLSKLFALLNAESSLSAT